MYRGTPHSTTKQTPYKLMQANATLPSMISHLLLKCDPVHVPSDDSSKVFNIGDSVLHYDKLSKLNNIGIIQERKSKNSYMVSFNGRLKHCSADDLSHTVIRNDAMEPVNEIVENDNSDTSSVYSDMSEDEFPSQRQRQQQWLLRDTQVGNRPDPVVTSPRRLHSGKVFNVLCK